MISDLILLSRYIEQYSLCDMIARLQLNSDAHHIARAASGGPGRSQVLIGPAGFPKFMTGSASGEPVRCIESSG